MNYFEIFNIPVSLKVDKETLRKRYLELSRESHPDYFVNSGAQQKDDILELSANLNKAYKTFSNEEATIRYVLMLKELLVDEEKYSLEPQFLMQMMEINEEVAELSIENNDNKRQQILKELKAIENEIYEPVQTIIEHYKEGITTREELLQVKDYYFKKKYLLRLHHQLKGIQ